MDFLIIIYIILGILPSLTWLFYYLTKDIHPEPKRMIFNVFLWGGFITLPVFFVQIGLMKLLEIANISSATNTMLYNLIYWFIVISFSEEFFKYLVIKIKVSDNLNLDEPLDIMLYMVVSALGFAAVENVLYLLPIIGQLPFDQTIAIYLIRSVGAVFLHTLCSAVIGYSLAHSFHYVRTRHLSIFIGIIIAVLLHGFFDFSIITLHEPIRYIVPIVIILTLAFLVFSGFGRLKKMKGVCRVK